MLDFDVHRLQLLVSAESDLACICNDRFAELGAINRVVRLFGQQSNGRVVVKLNAMSAVQAVAKQYKLDGVLQRMQDLPHRLQQ